MYTRKPDSLKRSPATHAHNSTRAKTFERDVKQPGTITKCIIVFNHFPEETFNKWKRKRLDAKPFEIAFI